MTSKNTRFAETTDVFQYTDTKSNNNDDDWLLSSPIETDNRRDNNNVRNLQPQRQVIRSLVPPQEHVVEFKEVIQESSFFDSEIYAMRRQLSKVKQVYKEKPIKENTAPIAQKPQASNPEPEKKEIERKNSQDLPQQISKQASTNKETRVEIEAPSKKEPQKPAIEQPLENLASPVRPNHTIIEGILNKQNENDKRKDRVTMSSKDWFKDILQPSAPAAEKTKAERQLTTNSTRHVNSRVTMDLKGISSLFEDNYNKYEALSSNKNRDIISRASIGRKSMSFRTNINYLPIDQYFQSLELENAQDDAEEERYFNTLEEASSLRVKKSEARLAKLQEELRTLDKELNSLPSQPQQLRYRIQDYQGALEPLKYLQYKYAIQILVFDISPNDSNSTYVEFILDNNIFCKLKRDEHSNKAEMRMTYSTITDIVHSQALIDMNSRVELLKVYFSTYLDRLSPYEIIQHLGVYYEEFLILQDDLSRCFTLFSVKSLEMTGSCEKLTFELAFKPGTNIHVLIKLLHLLEPNYYEFYHLQARKEITIPEEKLKGDDFIDLIEALVDIIS